LLVKKISTYEEKALLKAVAKGDGDAFRVLFTAYRPKVYYIARKLLQSDAQAEDALQEIFLKLWLNREKLPELHSFNAYLNTITRNHLYNMLRTLANEEVFLWRWCLPDGQGDGPETALSPMVLRELKDALQKAMTALTPQQKRVFELSRLEGLRHEEIAAVLDISKETVKKHIGEALRVVRDKIRTFQELATLGLLVLATALLKNLF
jgi:RNA polymerase sigma-70 factor (family 1)